MSDITRTNVTKSALQPLQLPRGRQLSFERPLVMGIANVTPDSFSDGGTFLAVDHAVGHALKMIEEGADLIDVGGESTRPGAEAVPAQEEIRRAVPVIQLLRKQTDVPISIDTYKAEVAKAALAAGADMINDISALRMDEQMAAVVAEGGVPVVLMHMQGTPQTMQQNPSYDDCVEEVAEFFTERIAYADVHRISREKIILDPGIGFGKRLEDNLVLLGHLERYKSFRLPILVGASRKGFIGKVSNSPRPASERLGGSLAAALAAILHGAHIVRVHDVAETVEAVKILQAIREHA